MAGGHLHFFVSGSKNARASNRPVAVGSRVDSLARRNAAAIREARPTSFNFQASWWTWPGDWMRARRAASTAVRGGSGGHSPNVPSSVGQPVVARPFCGHRAFRSNRSLHRYLRERFGGFRDLLT